MARLALAQGPAAALGGSRDRRWPGPRRPPLGADLGRAVEHERDEGLADPGPFGYVTMVGRGAGRSPLTWIRGLRGDGWTIHRIEPSADTPVKAGSRRVKRDSAPRP